MDDARIQATIEELVAEEHRLWEDQARGSHAETDRQRLEVVRATLDRCWDLLRQRRALRETGHKPSEAHVRPADVVKKYIG